MNVLDFEDVKARGTRRGKKLARRVIDKWNRPSTETEIGKVVARIKADPNLLAAQNPSDMQEMEARYGED